MKQLISLSLILLATSAAWAENPKFQFAGFKDVESAFASHESEIASLRAELASLQASQPAGYAPQCDAGCCCECCYGGYYAGYEAVVVKPLFSRSTAYFLEEPAPLNQGQTEVPFDWEMLYSSRIELGYVGCDGLGYRGRYWRFDNDASLSVTGAAGNISAGFGDDSINEIGISDVSDADFSHSLLVDVIDLEMTTGDCNRLYSAGIRYVRMEQVYRGTETGVTTPEAFFAAHDFEGLGLTAAMEYSQPYCNGVTVFFKARGSILYGESDFLAADVPTTAEIIGNNDQDLLAIGEVQLGTDWRTCLSCGHVLFVTAAIEAQYWMNAGTGAPGNNAVYDEGNYQNSNPLDADMGFFGVTLGAGLEY